MAPVEESHIQLSATEFTKLVQKPLFDAITRLEAAIGGLDSKLDARLQGLETKVELLEDWKHELAVEGRANEQHDGRSRRMWRGAALFGGWCTATASGWIVAIATVHKPH